MMVSTFDLSLGLDNALVALALGPLERDRAVRLGAVFGATGFLAAAAGSALHASVESTTIGTLAQGAELGRAATMVALAVAILGLALVSRWPRAGTGAALAGLALLLSVDDLVAGLGREPTAASLGHLAAGGLACGVLCIVAAHVGAGLTRSLAARDAAFVSACALLGCAAVGLA